MFPVLSVGGRWENWSRSQETAVYSPLIPLPHPPIIPASSHSLCDITLPLSNLFISPHHHPPLILATYSQPLSPHLPPHIQPLIIFHPLLCSVVHPLPPPPHPFPPLIKPLSPLHSPFINSLSTISPLIEPISSSPRPPPHPQAFRLITSLKLSLVCTLMCVRERAAPPPSLQHGR